MPELALIQTDDFELVVWSNNIDNSRQRLTDTLAARGKPLPHSAIQVSPALCERATGELKTTFDCNTAGPVFFENKPYEFEFIFDKQLNLSLGEQSPSIEHRLQSVEDAFHFSERSRSLRGTVNTGNDIGWLKFDLVYFHNGKRQRQSFSFEVFPTKMDMASDLQIMNTAIDKEFPLWRFSLAEKTRQQMQAARKPHPDFLLFWLAQFERLFDDMITGFKHIVGAPHSRLLSHSKSVRVDALNGKLPAKLEEKAARAIRDTKTGQRFTLDKKILDVDTPENRFIKSVLVTTTSRLSRIHAAASKNNRQPDNPRLADSFFKQLDAWRNRIQTFQRQPLFREVGKFSGLNKESLVLQQKPGYAKVYKAWQQLKWYLNVLEGDSSLSLRSVAELYEVWCFLEIRRILIEALGFNEVESRRIPLVNTGLEFTMQDGLRGTFQLERGDGTRLRLAHEPRFGKKGRSIKSWTTAQKPDIYLEAIFPDGEQIIWLFDAKYRIKNPEDSGNGRDEAPDDAINQMHRYRDALIHIENRRLPGVERKFRPVFGGYALYPGLYDQSTEANPYHTEITEVGIGAFSLLPADDHSGSIWLTQFLTDKLGEKSVQYEPAITDRQYVDEAPRIPYRGTEVTRFNDLVIIANQIGPNRDRAYIERFKRGEAGFYHTRLFAFERQKIEQHIVLEARYLAVALDSGANRRTIDFLYPILNASRVKRAAIDREISGTAAFNNPDELYWLFQLGRALKLKDALALEAEHGFTIKLTGREQLSDVTEWSSIAERYRSVH